MWGKSVFFLGHPRPKSKAESPSVPQFWCSLLFLRTPLDEELPKFDVMTHTVRGLVAAVSRYLPMRAGPQRFPILRSTYINSSMLNEAQDPKARSRPKL